MTRGATPGNQRALRHGGETAIKALQHGEPFKGLASRTELGVTDELDRDGRAEIVRRGAIRLETAARLYWAAVMAAADAGDEEKLHAYVARYGWLQAKALSAWAEVRKESGTKKADVRELLKQIRGAGDGDES